jgi:hypothetical protein
LISRRSRPSHADRNLRIAPSVFTLSLHRLLENMHLLYESLCIVVAIVLMKEQSWICFIHGGCCGCCLCSFWHARFLSFRCFSVSSGFAPTPRIGRKRQWSLAPASRFPGAGPGAPKPTVAQSPLNPIEGLSQSSGAPRSNTVRSPAIQRWRIAGFGSAVCR